MAGRAYHQLGAVDQALAAYSKAEELNPNNNYIYEERGSIYNDQGKFQDALADLDKALELAPRRSWAYKPRARAHFNLKHYDKALADIAKAVELCPNDTSNLVWILPQDAAACPDEGFRQGLLELADKTIELTDHRAGAYGVKGRILGAFGREEEALASIEEAFDRLPEGTSSYELVEALAEVSHLKEAIPYLLKLPQLQPEQARFSYQAALAQLGSGLVDSYRDTCRTMLQQFHDTETPADGLGRPGPACWGPRPSTIMRTSCGWPNKRSRPIRIRSLTRTRWEESSTGPTGLKRPSTR